MMVACGQTSRDIVIQVQDTIPVQLMPLNQVGRNTSIEATGVFTTEDETILGFKNGGVIAKIYVKEGDAIGKGQLLATVLTSEVDARANQAGLVLEKARRDYERVNKLYLDSVATLEQLQNAKTALHIAEQDIKSVEFNQQHSRIYAPASGYVLAKMANEGQVVGPGTPVLQVNGASQASWILKVGVSDAQWSQIEVGDAAAIFTDAMQGEELGARVLKKSEAIDPGSGTFTVQLKLNAIPSSKLAAGVFGRAVIQVKSKVEAEVWDIPYSALLDGNGKEGYVFVTEDNKTAKRQHVRVASIEKDRIVIDKGLEKATALVVSGSPYLLDGSAIKVVSSLK